MATKIKSEEKQIPHPVEPYENASRLPLKDIIFFNFIGGLSWALGATIGLSVIIYVLSLLVQNINLVPAVGSFASQVLDFIIDHNPNLQK